MPTQLRKLKIKRVDLVDVGANLDLKSGEGSHIMLWKAADGKQASVPFRWIAKALAHLVGRSHDEAIAVSKQAQSFDEALAVTELSDWYGKLCELKDAFWTSLCSIVYDTETTDKAARARASAQQFGAALESEVIAMLGDGGDVEKRGAKISRRRLQSLKDVRALLDAVIAEGDPIEEEAGEPDPIEKGAAMDKKPDLSKVPADVKAYIEDVEKRATDAEAKIPKPDPKPEDVLKSLAPEHRALVEKAMADSEAAKKQAAEAVEKAAKLEREDQLRTMVGVIKTYTALSMNPDDDAALFVKIKKSIEAEEWKRLVAILDGAQAVAKAGGVIGGQKGTDAQGDEGDDGSALATVRKRAAELVAKKQAATEQEAIAEIMRTDQALAARYRRESRKRSSDPDE